MQELDASWGRVTAVWWLMFWRGFVGGVLLGAAVGFVIGFVGAIFKVGAATTWFSGLAGLVIGVVWVLFVVRMALRKRYGDFRIALVPLTA